VNRVFRGLSPAIEKSPQRFDFKEFTLWWLSLTIAGQRNRLTVSFPIRIKTLSFTIKTFSVLTVKNPRENLGFIRFFGHLQVS
jgi:hypothetical protein